MLLTSGQGEFNEVLLNQQISLVTKQEIHSGISAVTKPFHYNVKTERRMERKMRNIQLKDHSNTTLNGTTQKQFIKQGWIISGRSRQLSLEPGPREAPVAPSSLHVSWFWSFD